MATELMRFVDYWIGIPLCFILQGIQCLVNLMPIKKRKNYPPKILFIKLSEMGSIILSHLLISHIKSEHPESDMFFLTFKRNRPIVEILNLIPSQNILSITEDSPLHFILDTLKAISRMRRERMDIVFDLELFSRFTAILTYLSGAFKRIGFYRYYFEGLYRGGLLTHNVQYNPLIHISKSLLSLAQVVRLNKKITPELERKIKDKDILLPRFISSSEEILQIKNRLAGLGVERTARLFLINPGDGIISSREWPIENFINLCQRILEDEKNYIIIIGTGGVSKKVDTIFQIPHHKRCLDLTNKTTISELLSLFNIGEALICNDCGLAHIASLTPIKKFVIFGPESPQLYSPLGPNCRILYSDLPCSPCLSAFNQRRSACKNSQCLKCIKPEEVYALIKANMT